MQRLIPEVQADDLIPTHAGVRAQALMNDGKLVDDFLIVKGQNSVHVCNAPFPAATSSIEIGKALIEQIPYLLDLKVVLQVQNLLSKRSSNEAINSKSAQEKESNFWSVHF